MQLQQALGAGQEFAHAFVAGGGSAEGSGEGFEAGFYFVVVGAAV